MEFASFSFDVFEQQFDSSANYIATGCFTRFVTIAKIIAQTL
jgi:hypothetical protein